MLHGFKLLIAGITCIIDGQSQVEAELILIRLRYIESTNDGTIYNFVTKSRSRKEKKGQ